MNSFNIEILPSGSLKLSLTSPEERGDILELMDYDHWTEMDVLLMLLEPYMCNGGFEPFDAGHGNPFVGLTDAPCIAESIDVLDDGKKEIVGRCWWYPQYETKNCMEELACNEFVIFASAD